MRLTPPPSEPEPPLRPRRQWCRWYKRNREASGYIANAEWKARHRANLRARGVYEIRYPFR